MFIKGEEMNRKFNNLVEGFINIGEGLVKILSLGYWYPKWSLDYWSWITYKDEDDIRDDLDLEYISKNTGLDNVNMGNLEKDIKNG
jgi:hypothetical protein